MAYKDTLKSKTNRVAEVGRSMTEMLAVLAVIGVLSIAALTGYRMAMNSYHANELLNNVRLMAANVIQREEIIPDATGLINTVEFNPTVSYPLKAETWGDTADLFVVVADDVQKGVCKSALDKVDGSYTVYVFNDENADGVRFDNNNDICDTTNQMQFLFNNTGLCEPSCPNCCYGKCCASDQACYEDTHSCGPNVNACTTMQNSCGSGCCDKGNSCCGGTCCQGFSECCGNKCGCGQAAYGVNLICDYNTNTCTCPSPFTRLVGGACLCTEGEIFVNGECTAAWCDSSDYPGYYNCYINLNGTTTRCGSDCKDTKLDKDSCSGYCSSLFCNNLGDYGSTTMAWSGLGCISEDSGLYCATAGAGSSWFCTETEAESPVCCECEANSFAKCSKGTCSRKDCEQFVSDNTTSKYSYVGDRAYGCEITKNGYVAYCAPMGGKWRCKYQTGRDMIPFCAECSAEDLATDTGGNCSDCFGMPKCPFNGWEWNTDLERCVGTYDGFEYSCDLSGENCYSGKTSERCGYNCPSADLSECHCGMCGNRCPEDYEYKYIEPDDATGDKGLWGCVKSFSDGRSLYFLDGNWCHYYSCHVREGKTTKLCGTGCGTGASANCESCGTYYMPECAGGKCLKTGTLIDEDGDGTDDCTCDGTISYGHCCETGHVWVEDANACLLFNCNNNQCLFDTFCIEETEDYKADEDGLCKCINEKKEIDLTKCLNNSYECKNVCLNGQSSGCVNTLERKDNGRCQTISNTKK